MSELQVTAPTDTSEVCEVGLRVGGRWRFEARGPDGIRMGYGGRDHEVRPPHLLVDTERGMKPEV